MFARDDQTKLGAEGPSEREAIVEVWCDQLTLYRQLGFPAGFETAGTKR